MTYVYFSRMRQRHAVIGRGRVTAKLAGACNCSSHSSADCNALYLDRIVFPFHFVRRQGTVGKTKNVVYVFFLVSNNRNILQIRMNKGKEG